MASPLYNPPIPFLGAIGGNMRPGKLVRIQGTVPHTANRFVVDLKCGPYGYHDVALHLSVRFPEATVVRNSFMDERWGPEERVGQMPFIRGAGFELMILCDPDHFKIAVNGQHYTEYIHRTPYERVTHLEIRQDVVVTLIQWEGADIAPAAPLAPGFVMPPASGPVPPLPLAGGPCPPIPPFPAHHGGPPGYLPHSPGCPPPPPDHPPGHFPPPPGCPPPPPGYSHQRHGYNQYPPYKSSGGLLDKAKHAIAGTIGTVGEHGPGMGTMHGGAALTGHLSPHKAKKSQKKAYKKALKYGLPIAGVAGVGLGAYTVHKAFHSSSSSSSSSSEEE